MKVPENTGWGTELRALRRSRGLSLAELGRRINLDYSYLARIERGERPPSRTLAEACDRVLGAKGVLSQRYNVLTHTAAKAPEPAAPIDDQVPGPAEIAAMFAMIPDFGMPVMVAGSAGKVTAAHIAALRQQVERINSADQQRGSATVVATAVRCYRRGRWMLDTGEYTRKLGIELAGVVGDAAECTGWLAYDNNHHKLARRLYSEALTLAEFSGDAGLQIRALVSMTRQSCHLVPTGGAGMARDALRASSRAADISRDISATFQVQALIAAREATAYAALGDKPGFERAIVAAWKAAERGAGTESEQTHRPWFSIACESGILAHEAKGRKYLGQSREAVRLFEAVIRQGGLIRRERTSCGIHMAASIADTGDAESAMAQGVAALRDLAPIFQSPRLIHDLQSVSVLARQHMQTATSASEFQRLVTAGRKEASAG